MSNSKEMTGEELYDIIVAANVELQKLLSLLLTIYADVDALTNATIPGKNALCALLTSDFNYLKNDVVRSYVAGKLYTSQDRLDILPDVDSKKLDSSLLLDILIKYILTSYMEDICVKCKGECCPNHNHNGQRCNRCRANGPTDKCWHSCRSCLTTAKECQKTICCKTCNTCIPCNKINFSKDVNVVLSNSELLSLTCPWYVIITSLEIAKYFRNLFGHITIQECKAFIEDGIVLTEQFKECKIPEQLERYVTFVFSNIVKHAEKKLGELHCPSDQLKNGVDQTMGNLKNIFSGNARQYWADVSKLKDIFEEGNNKLYERLEKRISEMKTDIIGNSNVNTQFLADKLDNIERKILNKTEKDETKDQGGSDKEDNKPVNWRSIYQGVVIKMDLEENVTGVSAVSDNYKIKIDHKTVAQTGKAYYETWNVDDSTTLLKIERLKDGDHIFEVCTESTSDNFNVNVDSNFDNPAQKIDEIGIATPCSNSKKYWERLIEAILNPQMHEDSTIKFSYSNGASSRIKTQKLKTFEEFCANYFKDNFMDQNLVVFPPFETIEKCHQTLVNCFINILKRRYTAAKKGVVLVSPKIGYLSRIISNTGSATDSISERECLLVFVEEESLVLVVGIAMQGKDIKEEISSVQNDVESFINIHCHRMKEQGLTIAGIIACPSVERRELTNHLPFQFADVDVELYETLFLCKDDIETERSFSKWWERSISVLNQRLDVPGEASEGIIFINIIGQHMVSMASVTASLPTLSCNPHDKLKTLILNKKQLHAINSPSKKKHIVGPFGSGKSLIGETILKNLMGKLKRNGEPSTLFYITCDSYSVIDCHVKSSVEMLADNTVKLVCGSLNELYRKYVNQHPSLMSVSLDILMKELVEKFPNPHFICDEVQCSVMTEDVAKSIDGYLKTILLQSHVVFIQQSMKKERKYQQQSVEADNFHLINGLELHRLQSVMRVAVEIQKLIFCAQEIIANHELTIAVPKRSTNTSNTSPVPRKKRRTADHVFDEATTSSEHVGITLVKQKDSKSIFEDLDASLKIFSRSSQNKTTQNAVTTKTTFFKGREGNKISSKKPLLIFLPEENDVDTIKILSFVLRNRCLQKNPVFIANSLQSARLLNHGVKACRKETIVHIPYLQRKTPENKQIAIEKNNHSRVLITDHKSFLGMEHEVVVSIVDPTEIMRHSIVEIVSRCTSYLYIFVLPRKVVNEDGSMDEIIVQWLKDDLVDTLSVELEVTDDESGELKVKDKKFIIYTQSDEFRSLSEEINSFRDDEFIEHLPDEETSKYLHKKLGKVAGNEIEDSIFHEINYNGKNWSFDDVYRLLENEDYETFHELLKYNGSMLNYMRDFNNWTFLMNASFKGRHSIVKYLTEQFADEIDVWAVDDDRFGRNAYHWAAWFDYVDVMKVLISFDRSRLNVGANDGETPLHRAASRNNKRIVELLLDAGADVDVVDNDGITPDRHPFVDDDTRMIIENHRTKSTS